MAASTGRIAQCLVDSTRSPSQSNHGESIMCERTHPSLKCAFVAWLVFLHLTLGLVLTFLVGLSHLGQAPEGKASPRPIGSLNEVALLDPDERHTETARTLTVVDGRSYFTGTVEACTGPSHRENDPCVARSDFGFHGVIPAGSVLLDEPPTYEEVLFNSYGVYELAEVPEEFLDTSAHLVVRGSFVADTTRCASHPLLFQQWIFGEETLPAQPSNQAVSVDDITFHHWTCFTELSVHEYLVGSGPSRISIQHPNSAVPYDTADTPSLDPYANDLARLKSRIADEYEGFEWVAWIGPSYNVMVESLTAYALWDVQKGDDDVVRVVSPDAAYYEEAGVTGSALDRLQAPLADFRRDIKAAHTTRIGRTSGRIGVGTNTPMLVTDVLKLPDYYEEIDAYDNPIATPAPPPTRPYAPTGLYVTRWNNPDPEVDIAWTAPVSSTVTHYKIVRIDSLGNEKVIATALPGEFTETTDRDLPVAGVEYTYTVIAVNDHGESAPSAGDSVVNGPPNPPTGLYVSLQIGTEADLEWEAPASSHVTGYRVERRQGNGAWVTLQANIPAVHLETTDFGLVSGEAYTYRVITLADDAESTPSAPYVLHVP